MATSADQAVLSGGGALQGALTEGVRVFKGVPFAKPPVGELRFKPAQPADSWEGVRQATEFSLAPVQSASTGATQNPAGEDCLYLNVFAPQEAGPHPVFVWLYGGGDFMGEAGIDMFDGTAFARQGVVLVTVNYRVGALGWMKLDHLLGPEYQGSSNAGMSDIVMALEWVQREIANFGGDPSRVTLGGQSAGAKDPMTLLASADGSRGLFQSLILESGTAQCVWDDHTSRVMSDNTLVQLGLTPDRAGELLTMDALALWEAFQAANVPGDYAAFYNRPTIDGQMITASGLDAARAGVVNGLRVLIGNNHDEYDLMLSVAPLTQDPGADRMNYVATPKMAQDINARYRKLRPDLADADRWFRIMCDEEWWIPNVRFVEALLTYGQGNQVWMYRFDFQPVDGPMKMRACHTAELPFVFDTLNSAYGKAMVGDTPGADVMATTMNAAWVRFIKGEDPGGGALPTWPQYDLDAREVMILDKECRVESDPWGDLRQAWTGVQ